MINIIIIDYFIFFTYNISLVDRENENF